MSLHFCQFILIMLFLYSKFYIVFVYVVPLVELENAASTMTVYKQMLWVWEFRSVDSQLSNYLHIFQDDDDNIYS